MTVPHCQQALFKDKNCEIERPLQHLTLAPYTSNLHKIA